MKYVLIRYKKIKLLINEKESIQPLIENLSDIEQLNKDVNGFYEKLFRLTGEQGSELELKKQNLISKIGYEIIGVPFTNQDAELYALDRGLNYTELELHGNVGKTNAAKAETKQSQIQMRVSVDQKNEWVKEAQKNGLKLTQWITKKLNNDI